MSDLASTRIVFASSCLLTLMACSSGGGELAGSLTAGSSPGGTTYGEFATAAGEGDEAGATTGTGSVSVGEAPEASTDGDAIADDTGDDAGGDTCPAGADGCRCYNGNCGFGLACIDDICQMADDSDPGDGDDGDDDGDGGDGDDGDDGGGGGDGEDGSGDAEPACPQDPYEPNEVESGALYMATITDDDDEARYIPGKIGPGETDWFFYRGADAAFSVVNPARNITSNGPIQVCKFVACEQGLGTDFNGCGAGWEATSPAGRPGCCTTGSSIAVDFGCFGTTNDRATVWFSISNASQCTDYSITYHF